MRKLLVAHTTDTHLGYRSSTISGREDDFSQTWMKACRAIVDSHPDLILHAGDVFHRPHPSWGSVNYFIQGAKILQEASVPILGITGNHDSPRLQMKSTVFSVLAETTPWIHLANTSKPEHFVFPDKELNVILVPHPCLLNPNLRDELFDICDELDRDWTNILVAHGDIKSGSRAEGEELGSIAIPELVFEFPWDYAALGHLHMAQPFGPNGWYAGSIERCGWSDFPASPAWTLVKLEKGKTVTHTQMDLPHRQFVLLPNVNCKGLSDVQVIDGVVKSIERQRLGNNPIVRVTLEQASFNRLRLLDRSISYAVKQLFPQIVFRVDFKNEDGPREVGEREVRKGPIHSLPELWKEFIEGRKYPTPEMQGNILAGGLSALEKAGASMAEADMGDERNAPVS